MPWNDNKGGGGGPWGGGGSSNNTRAWRLTSSLTPGIETLPSRCRIVSGVKVAAEAMVPAERAGARADLA